jgi:hypothetical protein
MSKPNLQEIKDISILLDQIDQYKHLILSESKKLEDTKNYYSNLENIEKDKILKDLTQKSSLLQLDKDIESYRGQEQGQKTLLFSKLDKAFQSFVDSDGMKNIINDAISRFEGEDYKVFCDPKFKSMLPGVDNVYPSGPGLLRLSSQTKEYILDPDYLKKLVFDRFLVSIISNN